MVLLSVRLSSVTLGLCIVTKRCVLEQQLLLFRSRLRSRQPLRHINHWISWKWLEIEAWFERTTNRKWHMGNQMVTWPRNVKLVTPVHLRFRFYDFTETRLKTKNHKFIVGEGQKARVAEVQPSPAVNILDILVLMHRIFETIIKNYENCMNKKAQLTLTNPHDAKACKNCSNSSCLVSFHRIPFPQIANA